jgi:HEXXH motif-containing protein
MELDHLWLSAKHFANLASSVGSPETIRILHHAEYSRRLLLLGTLADMIAEEPDVLGPLPALGSVWTAFEAVQTTAPGVLAEILMAPQVGVWLSRALRLLRSAHRPTDVGWHEIGYLHTVALAAAVRAHVELSTRVPMTNGNVVLPTVGEVGFESASGVQIADAWSREGKGEIRWHEHSIPLSDILGEQGPSGQFTALTVDHRGRTLSLTLDSISPYRNFDRPVPPRRLDENAIRRWKSQLTDAWKILASDWPEMADAMATGLTVIVPLPAGDGREVRSASTGDAFGAALLSPHPDPVTLAASMVHEFDHIQLGSLLHLLTLVREPIPGDPDVYAPWRDDPRPMHGLLQGIYAFLGISQFWQRHRRAAPPREAALADFEFAYARRQTAIALATLRRSDLLTELGCRFSLELAAQLRPLLAEPVPAAARWAAWATVVEHRAAWRIRHLATDPAGAARLSTAFLAGEAPEPTGIVSPTPLPSDGSRWYQSRLALYRLRLSRPAEFAAVTAGRAPLPPPAYGARPADLALVNGDPVAAESGYRAHIAADPSSVAGWTGLATTAPLTRSATAWRLLAYQPELVRAVYLAVRRQVATASPTSVADWLDRMPRRLVRAGMPG